MQDNPGGGDLDPADDVRRKNFSSVLSCIDKKTEEGCDQSGQFTAIETRKAVQFL